MSDHDLRKALHYDPLAEAESLSGKSYKADDATTMLGLGLMQFSSARKKQLLLERDDTLLSNELSRYLRIVKEEGFEQLLEIDFESKYNFKDKFFIFYHYGDGILLYFDTYGGDHLNGGKFCYNIKPHVDRREFSRFISSGCYRKVGDDMIWSGDHDCREALRFNLKGLRENGTFIQKWVDQPFLHLTHYGDRHEGSDYKITNAERIAMLPLAVQEAISGK